MNIVMLTRTTVFHAMGGMEVHIQTLSERLARQGHAVTIISTSRADGVSELEQSGVAYQFLSGTRPGRYSATWWRESIKAVRKAAHDGLVDVLHSQSAGAYGVIRSGIHTALHIPVVVSLHGTSLDELRTKLRLGFHPKALMAVKHLYDYLAHDRFYVSAAQAVIATSDSQAELIKRYFPVDPERVHLIYNGVDTDHFNPLVDPLDLESEYGIPSGRPRILTLARLKKEKGIQNMLAAFPFVLRQHPDCRLIIAGDGEYRPRLERTARDLGVARRTHFIGRVEYALLPRLMRACTVFVNSTIRENGYDLTVPQAMSAGLPVAVSDLRSVRTVVQEGLTGCMYQRDDFQALARILCRLLGESEFSAGLAGRAHDSVQRRFSLDAMAAATADVYSGIARKTHGR